MKNLSQIFVKTAPCGVVDNEENCKWKTENGTCKYLQEVKAHTAQLQKIDVNVNQLARRINETGRIYADDMDEIKRLMEEVWRLERRLLLQFKGLVK